MEGRGIGEFIAVTHCGGGGGGRADDMAKGYQREIQFKLAERRSAMCWCGEENTKWER